MNVKRYVLGSIAVYLVVYLAEFLFHGMIMVDSYNQYLELLRPETESSSYMLFMSLGFLILAFGFSYIFVQGYEGKGIGEGIRFGLIAGIAFGISANLINYSVFPWPSAWIVAWMAGETVIMMLAGAVIAMVYKPAGT
jgi:hypothetical protein